MASGENGQTGQTVTSHVEMDMRQGQEIVTTRLHQTEEYPCPGENSETIICTLNPCPSKVTLMSNVFVKESLGGKF